MLIRIKTAILAACGVLAIGAGSAVAEFPERPIKIIVPTSAGGAMDTLGRIVQRAFDEKGIFDQKVVVVNMPGAGGTIGTRAVKDAEPDGYTIGFWHDGLVTSKAMGVVDYDHNAFEIIGTTGFSAVGMGALGSSDLKSLDDVIAKLKAEPKSVSVATNIGLPVHFNPLIAFDMAGVEGLMVQIGGGSKRLAAVLGKHTDVAQFAVPEFVKFRASGLEPIVVFSAERDELLPDTPTAKESGIDLVLQSNRIWVAPKGTPDDVVKTLSDALNQVLSDAKVKEELVGLGMTPVFISPDDTKTMLENYRTMVAALVPNAKSLSE